MLKLAFRNIFRHKTRTGLTLAVIIFGVMGLILSGGFIEDIFIQLREATIHSRLGHIQVYKAGYTEVGRRNPYQFLLSDTGDRVEELRDLPHVSDVMVRLNFSGLLNNGHADLPIIGEGIEPAREMQLGSSLSIVSGRQLAAEDDYGILVGQGVAQALQLEPGDYLTLLANTPDGALNSLELEVVGAFRTFSRDFDSRAVRIPLTAAQELLDTGGVHSLVFSLDETGATGTVASLLKQRLSDEEFEVKTWFELADFYSKTVDLYRRQFGVMQLIILIMVMLSVTNSVNMAIYERTGEFGTLRALGDRKRDIFRLVLTENTLLGLLGGGLGVLLGCLLAWSISGIGIPMPPPPNSEMGYTAYIRLVPHVIMLACVVGAMATILAALWPAYRVSGLSVIEALRANV
jgi:putative ABC transport system permease protein